MNKNKIKDISILFLGCFGVGGYITIFYMLIRAGSDGITTLNFNAFNEMVFEFWLLLFLVIFIPILTISVISMKPEKKIVHYKVIFVPTKTIDQVVEENEKEQ